MRKLQTLVLNKDWQPISIFPLHTIPVEDAIRLSTREHGKSAIF